MIRRRKFFIIHEKLSNILGYKNTKTAKDSSGFRRAVIKTTRVGGGGRIRFSAEKPRRLRQSTGLPLRAAFRIRPQNTHTQKKSNTKRCWTFSGGGGRIRTIEAIRSRFTVCPLWPLGNSPIFIFCLSGWSR